MTSHHLRQKQSCWHYDFGSYSRVHYVSLVSWHPRGTAAPYIKPQWQGCTCHQHHLATHSQSLWALKFLITGPSPPPDRSSDAAKMTWSMSWCPLTDSPKAELHPSALSSLPFSKVTVARRLHSRRGLWVTPPCAKRRALFGNSPGHPC